MPWFRRLVVILTLLLLGPFFSAATGMADISGDWRTASRESAGIAPDPATVRDAVVQVYAARTFSWRGAFAVHSWVAFKEKDGAHFETHEVVGWGVRYGGDAIRSQAGVPDRYWYGAKPFLLGEIRGAEAEKAIREIRAAIKTYPWPSSYRSWPGPNSNSFTAWVIRHSPSLAVDLPPTAIGKDYLGRGRFLDRAPSGGGFQVSLWGVFGVLASATEGFEVNILGLSFGVDPGSKALRLPGIGTAELW